MWHHKWEVVKPSLSENTCFFFSIKVNLVAKIMQSAYLRDIFHVKHKKLPLLAVLTWFLILGKIQNVSQDADHCWWRHRPPAAPPPIKYTSSCREDQKLSTEGKIVSEYSHISKTLGAVSSTPQPHSLCQSGGMTLRERPRVNIKVFISRTIVRWWGTTRHVLVIETFVLLVFLSFFVLHEIDQVLKGRLKLYEKSAKRRVNYKGSFENGSSKVELYPDRFFFR